MKRLLLLLVASLPLAYIPLQGGCGAQSEGQLCSPLNGDLDCNTGLTCKSLGGEDGVCCQEASSHPACSGNTTSTSTTTKTTSSTTSSSSTGMGGSGGGGTGGSGSTSSSSGTGGTGGSGSTSSSSSSSTSSSGTGGGMDDGGTSDAGDGG